MMIGVRLGRLVGVMLGVQMMRVREMSVVAGRLVVALLGVFGGLAMVMSGALVMFRGVLVMFGGAFGVSHGRLLVIYPTSCGRFSLAPSCDKGATRRPVVRPFKMKLL
jgi:hypothetical protein